MICFSIAPQADNPISRILIKPEIYHLSQPIIDIPGASIENRQYQVDAKQIGLFSGSWKDVSKKGLKPKTHSSYTLNDGKVYTMIFQ